MLKKHDDNLLNILRIVAFGAFGLYLYKVYRKEGSLGSVTKNPQKFAVNTGKLVDSALLWTNLTPEHKMLLRKLGKDTLDGVLDSKNIPRHRHDEE